MLVFEVNINNSEMVFGTLSQPKNYTSEPGTVIFLDDGSSALQKGLLNR